VPSLSLALRALWFRRGVSFAVLLVATVTTAAAAAGPLYLRAGGESVLRDALTSAAPDVTGLDLAYSDASPEQVLPTLQKALDAEGPLPAHPDRIASLQYGVDLGGPPAQTRLMWRDGACEHLQLAAGRCPTGPREAVVSVRTQSSQRLAVGSALQGCPSSPYSIDSCVQKGGQVSLNVVGVYRLPGPDPFWFAQAFFDAHPALGEGPATLDTVFASRPALTVTRGSNVTAGVQLLLDPTLVRLDDEVRLRTQLAQLRTDLVRRDRGLLLTTKLDAVLDRADRDRRALGVSVLLVSLQLVALAFVVLRLVVADASEARAGEVALAKLRGYRAGATLALGLVEPLLLLVLALPLGLAVAYVSVRLLGAAVLVPGTPLALRPPFLLAALGALAGGLVAAVLAGRRVLTRPVVEQWRRTGEVRPGRAALLLELLVAVLAAAGLVALVAAGALREGRDSALPLLVPLLLVVVFALLGVRLLPAGCRALVRATRGSSRVGGFLAVRAVARRPAGLRLAALLAVTVGLATFAVDGSLVAGGNRAQRAATDVGADRVLVVRTGGGADLGQAVRRVDPAGRWAMAAEVWLPFGGLRGTVLAVDTAALPQVAHWRDDFATVALASLAEQLGGPAPPPLRLTGQELGVDLTTLALPQPTRELAALVSGPEGEVPVPLGRARSGSARYTGRLPGCAGGCTLTGLRLVRNGGPLGARLRGTLRLTGVAQRSAAGRWSPVPVDLAQPGGWHQRLVSSPAGSTVTPRAGSVDWSFSVGGGDSPTLERSTLPWPLRVSAGAGVVQTPATPEVANFDARPVPLQLTTPVGVVPQQGRTASLADLDFARRALPRFEEFAEQQVWLSDAAPPDAADRLQAAGLQVVQTRTTADRRALLDRTAPALGLLLFAFAGAAGAVLAAGATAVALYLSGRRRAFELAAMLAVGADRRSLLAGAVGEQLLVLGTALVLGVVSGLAAARLALPAMPELPDAGPPALRYAPHLVGLTVFLLTLVLVVLATATAAATGLLRSARPGLLRESAP